MRGVAFCVCLAFTPLTFAANAQVSGTVRDEKGLPLAAAKVHLVKADEARIAPCDPHGRYTFTEVKPGTFDYLAVSVPGEKSRFPFLFVRKGLELKENQDLKVEVNYQPAQPAGPAAAAVDAPKQLQGTDGVVRKRFHDVGIFNPLEWHWEKQRVGFRVPFHGQAIPESLLVFDTQTKKVVPHQVTNVVFTRGSQRMLQEATVHFLAEVPGKTRSTWRIFFGAEGKKVTPHKGMTLTPDGDLVQLSTGKLDVRLPSGLWHFKDGLALAKALPPLLGVRGPDGIWRGAGRLLSDWKVVAMNANVLHQGPIFLDYQISYRFANGLGYRITFRFEMDQPYFTAREESDGIAGAAWEFSAHANFAPEQGFAIHGEPRPQDFDYKENKTLAQITNYVHIHPTGYAVQSKREKMQDCLAVFSVNRGGWIDRRYALETWTPVRADPGGQMRLPWPWYYGSRHCAIRVEQRGPAKPDLVFHFPFHEGTREWGLAVFPKKLNEAQDRPGAKLSPKHFGQYRAPYIRYLPVKVGDLPLDKFKDYVLEWAPKALVRPRLNYRLDDLGRMRANLKHPFFAVLWDLEGMQEFRALVSGDPKLAWKAAAAFYDEVVQRWAPAVILGHDLGHVPYNQVSVRDLVNLCERYDLLEPTGVFSPEELAQLRAGLALAAYRFHDPNFMNYQYNPGQQDFDAARLSGVASVGFTFPDHPHAGRWVRENLDRLSDLLYVWQMPGGKWPENPVCYYQQTFCNFAYVAHQARTAGDEELLRSTDYQDFVRWLLALLTPPHPSDPDLLRKGLPAGIPYAKTVRTRHVPPVGDHAGPCGVEVRYDAALLAKGFAKADPELAGELMWAFNRGGAPAVLLRKKNPIANAQMVPPRFLIACLEPKDFGMEKAPPLDSRLLPGFGGVLRAGVDTPEESYVLYRCGAGGVRYGKWGDHTFIYYAKGVPLAIDGGEGEGVSTLLRADGKGGFFGGQIAALRSFEHLDYLVAQSPASGPEVRRHVLLFKNDYLILADEVVRPQPTQWLLSVLADQAVAKGGSVQFTGRLGVDLGVHFVGDGAKYPHKIARTQLDQGGMDPIAMQRLTVAVPQGGQMKAVLIPRDRRDRSPPVSLEESGAGLRIRRGTAEDLVFVGGPTAFDSKALRFHGRCAVMQRRDDGIRWHLLDGEILEAEGLSLRSTGAAISLWRHKDGRWLGQTDGKASTIFIGLPENGKKLRLLLDGKERSPRFLDGRLMLNLSAGPHQVELVIPPVGKVQR